MFDSMPSCQKGVWNGLSRVHGTGLNKLAAHNLDYLQAQVCTLYTPLCALSLLTIAPLAHAYCPLTKCDVFQAHSQRVLWV